MTNDPEKEPLAWAAPSSAADYEYTALMQLLGVSVSKHLLDEHFTLIWANDFYYQLIGWPKEEYEANFHNRPDLYYQPDPDDWAELGAAVGNALAAGESSYKLLSRIRRKNGDHIWVQFSAVFADEYVNGYQVAYSVLTNIDDVVRMQLEQSVTYESLPGFVAKYRVEPGLEPGLELTLLDSNARFREYFGEAAGGPAGSSLYFRNIEDNADVIAQHREALLAGQPVQFVMHVNSRKDIPLWLQVNATCVTRQDGHPVYLVIFIDITDVTELREMHQKLTEQAAALEEALAAAEHANRAKSEFLSRMSHDIRTPMNAILGMSSIAAAHIAEPERVQDCLSKIDVSSNLLLSLINDVLDMSKIESGRLTMAEEPFSLGEVIQNIVTIIQPSILQKHHSFDIRVSGLHHEQVLGDEHRLEQVFLNILSNAVKYTPDGGCLTLELRELEELPGAEGRNSPVGCFRARSGFAAGEMEADADKLPGAEGRNSPVGCFRARSGFAAGEMEADADKLPGAEGRNSPVGYGRYEFVFRDNGYGMTPEFLEKLFTPFERAEDATIAAIQGTGLGMAISRNIVRMMDGDISVQSTYGQGSAFTVTFSLKLQEEAPVSLPVPAGAVVLVVDDDPLACETTCEYLQELGLDALCALSGQEALAKAQAALAAGTPLLAVIMDLKMPGMDGIEATRRLRRVLGESVPVILLSAYDWSDCEARAREVSVSGFVAKPMLKSSLVHALERYVLREQAFLPHAAAGLGCAYPGKHLLLVEDNALNREIALELLGQTGAVVDTAENGLEAVEAFATAPDGWYDLIFMDLQMPVLGGMEATQRIRALPKAGAATVPIVAMTANVFAEDVAASKAAGMDGHLAKPLQLDQIRLVLERYLSA